MKDSIRWRSISWETAAAKNMWGRPSPPRAGAKWRWKSCIWFTRASNTNKPMGSLPRIPLGAPGLYPFPDIPIRALTRVRMDVAAFVGVAPRGAARLPSGERTAAVAVESFDEYRQFFGGF